MHLTPTESNRRLSHVVRRGLRVPLEALRIAIEGLVVGTSTLDDAGGAVDTLTRLRASALAIEEFCAPREPWPMDCSIAEIVGGVRAALPAEARERVLVALEAPDDRLTTDETMLVGAIARLVLNGLEAGGRPVLLHVSAAPEVVRIIVVDHGSGDLDLERDALPFESSKRGRVGLGLTLALRDIERLGGVLTQSASEHSTRLVIALSRAAMQREAA